MAEVSVRPATAGTWPDVRTVMGTKGDPSGCWCQWFKLSSADWRETKRADRERMLCDQVTTDAVPPGLLAYLGDDPVGWIAVESRPAYPRLLSARVVRGSTEPLDADDPSVWAVTCFVVRTGHRRQGVAQAMLEAAIAFAAAHGARVIEGYPVDVAQSASVSAANLYHGSLTLFERAGFDVVSRSGGRAVVALQPTRS